MARQIDTNMLISGQIAPRDLPEFQRQGVTMIINNRPDHEDADQPTSAEMLRAAAAAGLDYHHVPIARGMGPTDVEAMREAMAACGDGKMLAYCRSGYRSALAWAVAKRADGTPREELERRAAEAEIDLGPVSHLL